MALWFFKCFVTEGGKDLIDEWYQEMLPLKAQVKFLTILEHLRDTPHPQWGGFATSLTGHDGILEVKFRSRNEVYRPLGCFGPYRHDFTFLIGAREHGDDFEPREAPNTAVERRAIIHLNPERAHECDF